jgi:nucleotidyltransferase/DNA polymerase involved in DNA repair
LYNEQVARNIIHLDLDAFFCAVEEQRWRDLSGKPFAVGGRPAERGVVTSCSYPARKAGVRSAMPMARALQICPQLVVLPPDHQLYSENSRKVMERLQRWTVLQEITFPRDLSDKQALESTLHDLSDGVAAHLRREGLAARVVRVKIRWQDFTTCTRQTTMQQPADQGNEIYQAALVLFRKVWQPGDTVRLVGVGASKLEPPIRQLSLWDNGSEKDHRLQKTLDEIKDRFGKKVIERGRNQDG